MLTSNYAKIETLFLFALNLPMEFFQIIVHNLSSILSVIKVMHKLKCHLKDQINDVCSKKFISLY